MKYKVNDRVRIKSLDWYNENKDEYGQVDCGSRFFFAEMSDWCGKIATIKEICKTNCYRLEECYLDWTDEMIEGLVEEETKPNIIEEAKTYWDSIKDAWICPEGYIFKDENGNVINATKIVLEKKKKEYPKTFLGCCDVLGIEDTISRGVKGYKSNLLDTLQKLLICRDAYWKLYGEEMGLGKPWEPDWETLDTKYDIYNYRGVISHNNFTVVDRCVLVFPTAETRDAFYENFKELIESVKELL